MRALREMRYAHAVHWLALSDTVLASASATKEKPERAAKRARTLRMLAVALGEVERAADALAALQQADALPSAPVPDFATRLLRCRLEFRCGHLRDADAALGELLSAPLADDERSACISVAVEFGRCVWQVDRARALTPRRAGPARCTRSAPARRRAAPPARAVALLCSSASRKVRVSAHAARADLRVAVLLGESADDDDRRDKQRKAKEILLRVCERASASADARRLVPEASAAPVVSLLWSVVGGWRVAATDTVSSDQRDWLRIIACLSMGAQRGVAQLYADVVHRGATVWLTRARAQHSCVRCGH